MASDRLSRNGDLSAEAPSSKEFDGLVRSGLARLADAENPGNSLDSRFDLAYNAAHALCLAALRYCGFRSSKRYVVFQVLPDTLGLGPEVWSRPRQGTHKMRNQSEYEGIVDADDNLVREMVAACKLVAEKIQNLPRLT